MEQCRLPILGWSLNLTVSTTARSSTTDRQVDKLQSDLTTSREWSVRILSEPGIDVSVAEGGPSARSWTNRAVGPDFVDLEALSVVGADLDNFFQSPPSADQLGVILGSCFVLRCMREDGFAAYRLLSTGARQQVLHELQSSSLRLTRPGLVRSVFRQVLVPDAGSVLADLAVGTNACRRPPSNDRENSCFSGTPRV